jgi:hypothetical protein
LTPFSDRKIRERGTGLSRWLQTEVVLFILLLLTYSLVLLLLLRVETNKPKVETKLRPAHEKYYKCIKQSMSATISALKNRSKYNA